MYRIHHAAVFRFALGMTGDRIKAGEVTQDVFVWLIHHPTQFDPARGELGAFLGGVARKLLYRRERDERRWLPLAEAAQPRAGDSTDVCSRAIDTAGLPQGHRPAARIIIAKPWCFAIYSQGAGKPPFCWGAPSVRCVRACIARGNCWHANYGPNCGPTRKPGGLVCEV